MLVIMENRDVEHLLKAGLDLEALGRLDILKVDAAEGGGDETDTLYEFFDLQCVYLDIKDINVREAHIGTDVSCTVGRGEKTVCRGYDNIAGADAQRQHGQMQRRCTVGTGARIGGADACGQFLFKLVYSRSLGPPVGSQDLDHRLNVLLFDVLSTVRQKRFWL